MSVSIFGLIFIFLPCHSETDSLSQQQSIEIKSSVQKMMDIAAKDIFYNVPLACLKYFENTPDFYMASGEQMVFPSHDSATKFIKELVKQIQKIELRWGNIRVDPMSNKFANVAVIWNEDLTDFSGNQTSHSGYFSAVSEKTIQGWQLRNAHWYFSK